MTFLKITLATVWRRAGRWIGTEVDRYRCPDNGGWQLRWGNGHGNGEVHLRAVR